MTLFAFAGSCGFFGASGLTNGVLPSAATACLAKKAASSIPAIATPVNPAPASQRNWRRVRPHWVPALSVFGLLISCSSSRLIQVKELVQVQGDEAESRQGGVGGLPVF